MTTQRLLAIDAICQRGSIRDSDVAMLQRAFTNEAHISAGDVDALFRVHALARVQDPSWSDFFIDTMTDYVIRELEPAGYVTTSHAGWLIARVSNAGRIRSKTEHDLLLNVIDKARWAPESLIAFALTQIRDAVVSGMGPLRLGKPDSPGKITLSELEQVRALLFAYGADGPSAITQTEADLLLDMDGAIHARQERTGLHDPDWADLFAKAMTSAVLSASGYSGPTREEALNEAVLLCREAPHLGKGAPQVAEALGADIVSSYRRQCAETSALLRLEHQRIEIITGEPVAAADGGGLANRLREGDGAYSPTLAQVVEALQAAGLELHGELGGSERSGVFAA